MRGIIRMKRIHGTQSVSIPGWAVLSILLLLGPRSLAAETYYVHQETGDDGNSGLSLEDALATIQEAADRAGPGDLCWVMQGNYDERVRITTSGAPGEPIAFDATDGVVTRGFDITADYIHVSSFEVTGTDADTRNGVGIRVEGKFCEISSNLIHDVAHVGIMLFADPRDSPDTSSCTVLGNWIERAGMAGIEVYGTDNLIEYNEISHTLQHTPGWTSPPSGADADGMRFFGSGHIVRSNHIHDILMSDEGNENPHIDCFQTWGPAHDIVFEQNFCDNPNDGMQGFMVEEINSPVEHLIVRNNVMITFRLLNLWDCENSVIANNSFKSSLSYTGASGYGIELHGSSGATVVNNLFYDVGRHSFPYLTHDDESESGMTVGTNAVFMSDGEPPAGTAWPGDLWQVDPLVVDAANNDFHPTAGSPLVNAGTAIDEVTNDFEGNPRPYGPAHDIGAFEYFVPTVEEGPVWEEVETVETVEQDGSIVPDTWGDATGVDGLSDPGQDNGPAAGDSGCSCSFVQ
jgi:hypothetical protein